MNKRKVNKVIKDINSVIKSRSSKLSRKDLEILIEIKAGLQAESTKEGWMKYINQLLKFIGVTAELLNKFVG